MSYQGLMAAHEAVFPTRPLILFRLPHSVSLLLYLIPSPALTSVFLVCLLLTLLLLIFNFRFYQYVAALLINIKKPVS